MVVSPGRQSDSGGLLRARQRRGGSMSKSLPILALAAALAAVTPAHGQVLQVSVTAGGITSGVPLGGSLALTSTGIGQAVFANVTVRYTGITTATISALSVTGSSEMTLV